MKEIPLTKGLVALVDDEDYERAMLYTWYANHGYAIRATPRVSGIQGFQHMSNYIMRAPNTVMFDHKDRNPLNNQRFNLRPCTHAQNMRNAVRPVGRSGYRGVSYTPQGNKHWCASIKINSLCKRLGCFDDPAMAARVYDAAAVKYHGEFATLNFQEATK